MKFFVTGATGFIGGHLAQKLIARGDQITCLVRNPDKASESDETRRDAREG